MTFMKLKHDWFVAVAKWRAARPKTRFVAACDARAVNTRYYFTIDRFVHRIEASTLCMMDVRTPASFHEYARRYEDWT